MEACTWCHRPIAKTLHDWSLDKPPFSSAPAMLCGVRAAIAALDLLGGAISAELPSNGKTRQHMDCELSHTLLFDTLSSGRQSLRITTLTSARPTNSQVCLLLGDKPEDSKIVKLTGEDWQEVHTGAFWSARTGDRFAVLG